MMFFTADHHFGHANIIKYCNRPFANVDEMDTELIRRWNEVITPGDTVFHLGDFTLGEYAEMYMNLLHGELCILNIPFHHDRRWLERYNMIGQKFLFQTVATVKTYLNDWTCDIQLLPAIYTLEHDGVVLALSHFPLKEWDRKHYGAIHLHGHSHGNLVYDDKAYDVGVDNNDFYPVSFTAIKERLT